MFVFVLILVAEIRFPHKKLVSFQSNQLIIGLHHRPFRCQKKTFQERKVWFSVLYVIFDIWSIKLYIVIGCISTGRVMINIIYAQAKEMRSKLTRLFGSNFKSVINKSSVRYSSLRFFNPEYEIGITRLLNSKKWTGGQLIHYFLTLYRFTEMQSSIESTLVQLVQQINQFIKLGLIVSINDGQIIKNYIGCHPRVLDFPEKRNVEVMENLLMFRLNSKNIGKPSILSKIVKCFSVGY